MFSKAKRSTTAKIEAISGAWAILIMAMLATTATLYDQTPNADTASNTHITYTSQNAPIY